MLFVQELTSLIPINHMHYFRIRIRVRSTVELLTDKPGFSFPRGRRLAMGLVIWLALMSVPTAINSHSER